MRFTCSNTLVEQARSAIPLASQTLSRSHVRFPQEYPKFIASGRGCRVRDVDDNEYIDFICGLGSITLGYRDPQVDTAVLEWVRERGVGFSLPTSLELRLADELLALTPWADLVRFAKGGSDVVSAAVRLARAHTERDAVLVLEGGYHGWHDWFACRMEGRSAGVPLTVKIWTVKASISDVRPVLANIIPGLEVPFGDTVAAMVLEPAHFTDDQLHGLASECRQYGIVLIFDEVVSGFRYALGGWHVAQGVEPDLVCFGKGMGNGYPVSALVGVGDVMDRLERDVFFSSTFGGDPVGLVAALATIKELRRTNAIEGMRKRGAAFGVVLRKLMAENGLEDVVRMDGHPQMLHISIPDLAVRSVFLQEMAARGILIYNSNTLCAAHTGYELERLYQAYKEVLPILRVVAGGDISILRGPVIQQAEVRR